MAEIKSFNLGNLRQEEDLGFHKIAKVEIAKCTDPKMKTVQNDYESAFNAFDVALKQGGGENVLSNPIATQDAVCDQVYHGLDIQVANMENHFDPEKAEIARQARIILKKYGDPRHLPYLEETGVIHNLIQELEAFDKAIPGEPENPDENPDILSINIENNRLQHIGAREWLDQLKIENDRFNALFGERNTQQSTILIGISKTTRQATDLAYRNAIKRINALAEINGDGDYIEIINALNVLTDRQRTILNTRSTNHAKKKKKEDTEAPDIL